MKNRRLHCAAIAAVCMLSAALLGPGSTPAQGTAAPAGTLAEAAEIEAQRLRPMCRQVLEELLEKGGDFGGYGAAAWSLLDELEPSAAEMGQLMEAELHSGLDPGALGATEAFLATEAGRKMLWLGRESVSTSGRRGLARSARDVVGQFSPERQERIRELDAALFESRTTADVAAVLFGIVQATADRVQAAVPEDAEWAEEPSDILRWIEEDLASATLQELGYRTSRFSDDELLEVLSFARSSAGQAYFAARYNASVSVAHTVVERLLPKLDQGLRDELWEYLREREGEEEQDEGDGP
ncbi:MAG: hypothetical protein AAGD06_17995 [Acidobacteriota bacterium]